MSSRLRPWLGPAAIAAAGLAVHVCCGGRYGFFRDELYFVVCGERLAWGYVDQPPLVAAVARFAWWLSGDGRSVLAFRLPAVLAHAGTILLAAGMARRLGGGTLAMALAAAAALAAAVEMAQGHLLTMNVLEILLWSGVALCALQAADGRRRLWLLAGALLGLALLAKYSAGFLALGLLAGIVATRARRELASPWLWAGVGLAALLALPSALWQWRHGLPFLELLRNGQIYKNAPLGPGQLLGGLVLEEGALGVALSLVGFAHLLARREGEKARFLGVALGLVAVALAALGGKPYYFAPVFPALFAAGAVAVEQWLPPASPWRWAPLGLVLLLGVPALPVAIPLLPPAATAAWSARLGVEPPHLERMKYGALPQHLADQFGWEERVAAVAAAWEALPAADRARAVIVTTNYGRAAAIDLLGRRLGLPRPISGHNQYYLWGVPPGVHDVALAVGGDAEGYARAFETVTPVGRTPEIPWGMPYESGIPLYLLRGPRASPAALLERMRSYH